MALAAKMPWYHSTGNRDDGFESSSSASLLHSIYGSQASQLLFSSSSSGYIGSESNMSAAVGSTERIPASPAASHLASQGHSLQKTKPQRSRVRPKSSPASGIVSRAQKRSEGMAVELTVRKTSVDQYTPDMPHLIEDEDGISSELLLSSQPPPQGAGVGTRGGRGRQVARRPASAAVTSQRRPPSASHLSTGAGQRRAGYTRPKTALGIVSNPMLKCHQDVY